MTQYSATFFIPKQTRTYSVLTYNHNGIIFFVTELTRYDFVRGKRKRVEGDAVVLTWHRFIAEKWRGVSVYDEWMNDVVGDESRDQNESPKTTLLLSPPA